MIETNSTSDKVISMVAHMGIIGWLMAFVLNKDSKSEFVAFHLRQMLGLMLLAFVLLIIINLININLLSWIVYLGLVALWIMGFLGAYSGNAGEVPIFGANFQKWFKGI